MAAPNRAAVRPNLPRACWRSGSTCAFKSWKEFGAHVHRVVADSLECAPAEVGDHRLECADAGRLHLEVLRAKAEGRHFEGLILCGRSDAVTRSRRRTRHLSQTTNSWFKPSMLAFVKHTFPVLSVATFPGRPDASGNEGVEFSNDPFICLICQKKNRKS